MLWFEGSIAEAVALSKQRNAIFVVFIEGENDLSAEMAAIIDESDVVKRLSDVNNFLPIKLMSGSSNYIHFAQIYQFVPVPSLFFIGRNGTPLEVVCAGVQAASLAARIDRILAEHRKEKPTPSGSNQDLKNATATLLHTEAAHSRGSGEASSAAAQPEDGNKPTEPETSSGPSPPKQQKTTFVEVSKSGKEYDVVCEGDVCRRVPKASTDGAGPSSANVVIAETNKDRIPASAHVEQPVRINSENNMDDKIEKAKELIEAKRREKAAKEKELEKQKELERRATGQGVTELKKWQADQELKQIQEERKREKLENNLARQRILEQIAQDRAERRARDQPPPPAAPPQSHTQDQRMDMSSQLAEYRAERKAKQQQAKPSPVATPPVEPEQTSAGDGSGQARIQFKLPDGTSHTAHFSATGTLATVRQYVADNLQLSESQFALWTAFPRRELTQTDADLRALQLTPSAALLILPRRQNNNTVAAPSTLSVFITFVTTLFTQYILQPTQYVYNWVHTRLFPRTPGGGSHPPERRLTPPGGVGGVTLGGSGLGVGGLGGVRRRGNIHRLGDNHQDDDNNTWNGNSTQQM